jgi:hypothetical protein
MLKRDSVNVEQNCRQMQDFVTDAAEGFSELTRIQLNIVCANLTLEGAMLEAVYSERLKIKGRT